MFYFTVAACSIIIMIVMCIFGWWINRPEMIIENENEKLTKEIKDLFIEKYKIGKSYIFLNGPKLRINYHNNWPHTYEVQIEWLDKNYTYNKAVICRDIEKVLIPIIEEVPIPV